MVGRNNKKEVGRVKKYYKNLTEERKKEISKNISESHKGKKVSEEIKEKLSKLNSKFSDSEVLEIDILIKKGVPYTKISKQFNISLSQITSIKQRKTYKWLWYIEPEN